MVKSGLELLQLCSNLFLYSSALWPCKCLFAKSIRFVLILTLGQWQNAFDNVRLRKNLIFFLEPSSLTWASGSLSLLSIREGSLVTNLLTGRSPPKTCESNFIHHNFLQSGKQHSRCKAILPSIVLSQQCCEVYVISLTVAKPLWVLTSKYYWNHLPWVYWPDPPLPYELA